MCRRLERPKTPLFPTHDVWMAWAAARLGYRWRWVHAQQCVGVWAPCGSRSLTCRRTRTAPNQLSHRDNLLVGDVATLSACVEQEVICFSGEGDEMIIRLTSSELCLQETKGWTNVKITNRKYPCNASFSVPVDGSQVPCSRFVLRPYSLGWEEGEEKAGTHLPDLINASQMGEAPTQLSFPVACIHQLLPGPPCHQQGSPAPPPRPGPAQVTRVSRLCLCFLTPRFVTSWKNQCCLIFPGRSFISIPISCARSHTQNVVALTFSSSLHTFVFQCSSSKCRATETRRLHQESTSVLKIALQQLSPLLLCKFLTSLHLLRCCPLSSGGNHRCAHRSGFLRA